MNNNLKLLINRLEAKCKYYGPRRKVVSMHVNEVKFLIKELYNYEKQVSTSTDKLEESRLGDQECNTPTVE